MKKLLLSLLMGAQLWADAPAPTSGPSALRNLVKNATSSPGGAAGDALKGASGLSDAEKSVHERLATTAAGGTMLPTGAGNTPPAAAQQAGQNQPANQSVSQQPATQPANQPTGQQTSQPPAAVQNGMQAQALTQAVPPATQEMVKVIFAQVPLMPLGKNIATAVDSIFETTLGLPPDALADVRKLYGLMQKFALDELAAKGQKITADALTVDQLRNASFWQNNLKMMTASSFDYEFGLLEA